MRAVAMLVMGAPLLAWGDQVQLAHPANPSFASAYSTATPLALGMRVLVTTATRRCMASEGWSLRLYALGALQGYEARILGPRELVDGCVRELEAVLPRDMPLGVAEAVLTDRDGNAMDPDAVRILPVQFALLHDATRALARRVDGASTAPLTLAAPARVGMRVNVRGAGLGSARGEDVMLRVGEARVRPLLVRPVDGEPGIEEIEFAIPANLGFYGCYVPVAAEVRGVETNVASIPVADGAGPCRHRLGLTEAQMQHLDAGGRMPLVEWWLSRQYDLAEVSYLELAGVRSGMAGAAAVAYAAGMDEAPLRAGCRVGAATGVWVRDAVYRGREEVVERLRLGVLEMTSPDGQKESVRHDALGANLGGLFARGGDARYAVGVWQLRARGEDAEFDWRARMAPDVRPEGFDAAALVNADGSQEVRWEGGEYEAEDWMGLRLRKVGARSELLCWAPARDGQMRVAMDEFQKIPVGDAAFGGSVVEMWVRREGASVAPFRMRDGKEGVGIVGAAGIGSVWLEE